MSRVKKAVIVPHSNVYRACLRFAKDPTTRAHYDWRGIDCEGRPSVHSPALCRCNTRARKTRSCTHLQWDAFLWTSPAHDIDQTMLGGCRRISSRFPSTFFFFYFTINLILRRLTLFRLANDLTIRPSRNLFLGIIKSFPRSRSAYLWRSFRRSCFALNQLNKSIGWWKTIFPIFVFQKATDF